ncbi:YdcF family protein [Wenxinia marina]|uniref:DUF218 domain-containing protein n=1 Tax=Wenxinia marina DSM 24838 TaxID=1123501 RepID=A0A0D0PZ17_9RHOB|nr:YdcF family protein [Wenxinia marina]KIQ67629.1 hypothetical protein Wenmar_03758 [Wenxinia marina DSM 24838]GGL80132.1 hypothetical protein GCM10011392_38390 [Wenxinia marina]
MRRALRRLGWLALLALLLPALAVSGSMALSPRCADLDGRWDAAVVLGEGLGRFRGLSEGGLDRTLAGAGLQTSGKVATLIFSGRNGGRTPIVADEMARIAVAEGVPPGAARAEIRSDSTLENAAYSLAMLSPDETFVVVTEGYHLWRSWASFAWAGRAPDAICQSSPIANRDPAFVAGRLAREAAAWGLNVARGTLWSVAALLGREDDLPERFLD